jgi:hypothetical protein
MVPNDRVQNWNRGLDRFWTGNGKINYRVNSGVTEKNAI